MCLWGVVVSIQFMCVVKKVIMSHIEIKLRRVDIYENLAQNICHHVIFSNVSSSWSSVNAGVPLGSILGLLLFIILSVMLLKTLVQILDSSQMTPAFIMLLKIRSLHQLSLTGIYRGLTLGRILGQSLLVPPKQRKCYFPGEQSEIIILS